MKDWLEFDNKRQKLKKIEFKGLSTAIMKDRDSKRKVMRKKID